MSSPSRMGWRSKVILDSVLNVFARRRGRSDRDLSFDRGPCRENLRDFRGAATQDFFVHLRQLAPKDDRRGSPRPGELFEGLDGAERRLEERRGEEHTSGLQ